MMANLPGTRSGADIEALHDMRVASRRLRAALRGFCEAFAPEALKPVADEVGSVTRALGEARDQDVFIEFLQGYAQANPDQIIVWLVEREERIRDGARLRLLDELERLEESDMPGIISSLLSGAQLVSEDGYASSFAAHAEPLIRLRMSKLKSLGKAIHDPKNVAELHLMRIAAKRLRYSMELFVPAFGKDMSDKISDVKLLQEQLGTVHDCDVWVDKLNGYREEPGLAPERLAAVDAVIDERTKKRQETYAEALAHWCGLEKSGFDKGLVKLVSTKPAKVKKANQAKETPERPAVEAPKQRVPKKKETIIMPKPPTEVELARTAVEQAASTLLVATSGFSKLAKQVELLDVTLVGLPEGDAKVDKRLAKLRQVLESLPQDGAISDKKAEKLAEEVRAIRKKLDADGSQS